MKRFFTQICLTLVLAAVLFGCASTSVNDDSSPVAGKRIAYIINMAPSDIFLDAANGARETAAKLGMTCSVHFTGGYDSMFITYVRVLADEGYDGLFLSHGGASYSYELIKEVLAKHPDLKIVTFDTQFIDSSGKEAEIEGVTRFFQDDSQLASLLLDYLIGLFDEKQGPVRLLKVWVPDYIAAFDRRQKGYAGYEESGKIETVMTISPDVSVPDVENAAYAAMKEALKDVSSDEYDAVWVAYDAYGRGVWKAMMEAYADKPMVSVDICQADIEMMLSPDSVWKASSCTDFRANGEQGVRLLALEMAGCLENGSVLEMPASLVTADDVKKSDDGYVITASGYGDAGNYASSLWLKNLIGY